jgi:hypothetical protein
VRKIVIFIIATTLLAPTQALAAIDKKNTCSKLNLNKVKNNLICLKNGKTYKWTAKEIVNSTPIVLQPTKITKIYQNMLGSFKDKTEYFKLTVITSPKVDKQRVDEIVSKYEKSVNFFPMPVNKKITWVFLNEDEKDWWIQKSSEIDPNTNLGWWDSGHCQISKVSMCSYGNANTNIPIFYMVIGSSSQWEAREQMVADHESAHMYQNLYWTNYHANCWVVEGHASAIGLAISSKNMDIGLYRQGQIRDIQKIFPNYKTFSIDDWISAYNKINSDNDFCFSNGAGYSMGMLAIESMYELYDGKIVNEFFIDYSKSRNFNESLIKYFKINEFEFYKNVAKYVKDAV